MQSLYLALLLSAATSSPLPGQDGNICHLSTLSSHIVTTSGLLDLVQPVNTDSNLDDNPVVILLQPTSFKNVLAGFPDLDDFSGFSRFPSFSGVENIPHPPQIELKDIFGSDKEQPLNPVGSDCGLICKVDYMRTIYLVQNKMSGFRDTRGSAGSV